MSVFFSFRRSLVTMRSGRAAWLALLAFSALSLAAQTWSVTTLAGISPGSADGVGSNARFYRPAGIAADSSGNIFVADTNNFTIRKINPAGVVSTLAGSPGQYGNVDGPGAVARFLRPMQMAIDRAGTLYVVDNGNFSLRAVTPSGVVSSIKGFYSPYGVAADAVGNVFVSDLDNTIKMVTPAGAIKTLAGTAGVEGAANGTGSAARFKFPASLAVGPSGDVYVVDSGNGKIRKVTPAGVVTTVATAVNQRSIAVDTAGNVYVGDSNIQQISPEGKVTIFAGFYAGGGVVVGGGADGPAISATFGDISALAFDRSGNLWMADGMDSTIRKLDPSGTVTTVAGALSPGHMDGPFYAARFYGPEGIAIDGAGALYVCDAENATIRKVLPTGAVTTLAGSPGLTGFDNGIGNQALFLNPRAMAVDGAGTAYVTDANAVRAISPTGVVSTLAGSPIPGSADGLGAAAGFFQPSGLAVDHAGNVFVADAGNHTIRRIAANGAVTTVAGVAGQSGATDGPAAAARFNNPYGIAVDGSGNLYVTEPGNHRIRKISVDGVVSTFAGSTEGFTDGVGVLAKFGTPTGIAVDATGNVFVVENGFATLRRITPGGVVSTLAGLGGTTGTADGVGSDARFDYPLCVAVDQAGNLYVTDTANNAIRLVRTGSNPKIVYPPQPVVTSPGATATLSVLASGAPPFSYQWSFNGQPIAGATGNVLSLSSIQPFAAGNYSVTVTNSAGSVSSSLASVAVNSPPVIMVQPVGQSIVAGVSASFAVTATGSPAPTYQWTKSGVPLLGATNPSLTIANAQPTDAGAYSVVVTNAAGSLTSAIAQLAVTGRITNLSVRTNLGSGQVLIVGFVSTASKSLLVRAIGPALAGFGVSGVLSSPHLDVYNSSSVRFDGNAGWNSILAPVFSAVGAFGLTPGSADAALQNNFTGANTAQISGAGSGVVLVELYDADLAAITRLSNVSARNVVGTGDNIMIAGFVVGGAAEKLLIRGIGPALTAFGVGSALADPRLEIYNSTGVLVASNDNWDPSIAPTFATTGAFGLTPGSKDAALVITLPPGAYSAQLSGVGGLTGEGLIEVYEVP